MMLSSPFSGKAITGLRYNDTPVQSQSERDQTVAGNEDSQQRLGIRRIRGAYAAGWSFSAAGRFLPAACYNKEGGMPHDVPFRGSPVSAAVFSVPPFFDSMTLPVWLTTAARILGSILLLIIAVSDIKTRTVKNIWFLLLLLTGFFSGSGVGDKAAGFLLPLLFAVYLGALTGQTSGGADLKMYAAFGLFAGYRLFCFSLAVAFVLSFLIGILLRKPMRRRVPACSYLSAGYFLVSAAEVLLRLFS